MFCIKAKAPTIAAMVTIIPANINSTLLEPSIATSPCNNAEIIPKTRTIGVNDSKTEDRALAFSTVFFMLSIRANAPAIANIVTDNIVNNDTINIIGPNADFTPPPPYLVSISFKILKINAAMPPTVPITILRAIAEAINFTGSVPCKPCKA